ncbi:uncharacterized protein LOC101859439 [Aplysia californica]|uniref:Uncharacterized protein LOC101859439 n=1 Tax=Aplysia californica TaxID=6500 RepID=A0ABM0K4J1_APLCA|nr:uncharacterized protein LOC101859439 [Aplysia californica]
MERQKLVYFAHSRTSRVLTPTVVRRRGWVSSTSLGDALGDAPGHAPLASIEPDIIGGAKRGSLVPAHRSRKVGDSSWNKIRKPASEGNVCDVDDECPDSDIMPVDISYGSRHRGSSSSRVNHRVVQRGQKSSDDLSSSFPDDCDFIEDFEPGLSRNRTMRHNSVSGFSDFHKQRLSNSSKWGNSSQRLARGPSLTMPADFLSTGQFREGNSVSSSTLVLPRRTITHSPKTAKSVQNVDELNQPPQTNEKWKPGRRYARSKEFELNKRLNKSADDCLDMIPTVKSKSGGYIKQVVISDSEPSPSVSSLDRRSRPLKIPAVGDTHGTVAPADTIGNDTRLSDTRPCPPRKEHCSGGTSSQNSDSCSLNQRSSVRQPDNSTVVEKQHRTLPEMQTPLLNSSDDVLQTLHTPRSRRPLVNKLDIDILGSMESLPISGGNSCPSPSIDAYSNKKSSLSDVSLLPSQQHKSSPGSLLEHSTSAVKESTQHLRVPLSNGEQMSDFGKGKEDGSEEFRTPFRNIVYDRSDPGCGQSDVSDPRCVGDTVEDEETVSGKENVCEGEESSNFKPRWKRNSMRLATQGYTSMSDLTNSVELLNLVSENDRPQHGSVEDSCFEESTGDNRKYDFEQRNISSSEECVTPVAPSVTFTSPVEERRDGASVRNSLVEVAEKLSVPRRDKSNLNGNPVKRQSLKLATSSLSDLTCEVVEEHEEEENEEEEERGDLSRDSGNDAMTVISSRISGEYSCEKENGTTRAESDSVSSDSGVLVHNLSHRKGNTEESSIESPSVLRTRLTPGPSPGRRSDASSSLAYSSDNSPASLRSGQSVNTKDEEERTNKIKRNSLRLATSSISDLTCSFDEVDFTDFSPIFHQVLSGDIDKTSRWSENHREPVQVYNSPEPQRRDSRGSSFSSGKNSSFGSFYSCQSLESSRSPLSSPTNATGRHSNPPLSASPPRKFGSPKKERGKSGVCEWSRSVDALSLISDTDESFITARDTESVASRFGSDVHRDFSPRCQPLPISRQSPYTRPAPTLPKTGSKMSVSDKQFDKSRTIFGKPSSPKHSKKTSPPMQHYGSKFEGGYSLGGQRRDSPGKVVNSKRAWNDVPLHSKTPLISKQQSPDKNSVRTKHDLLTSYRERDRQQPVAGREATPPTLDTRRLNYGRQSPEKRYPRNTFDYAREPSEFSADEDSLSMQSSIYSLTDSENQWPEMPRSPPSLGKPKRKQYAGFDSQPLPIDSFFSDSSSVYTGASCSSRAPSRSADLENSYRGSDWSIDVTGNMRSATSMVSPSCHGTLSQQQHHDTDSIASSRHRGNGNRSDVASIDSRQGSKAYQDTMSSTETVADDEEVKTPVEFGQDMPRFDAFINSNRSSLLDENNGKNNDLPQLAESTPKSTRSRSQYVCEEKVFDNSEAEKLFSLSGVSNSVDSKSYSEDGQFLFPHGSKCSTLTASSSVTVPRTQLLPKHKYFSSKDIIDLLLTPDRTGSGTTASLTSLEKQAHKVCRAILCCNDMEQVLPGKAYHL